jgi:hypothetical protein
MDFSMSAAPDSIVKPPEPSMRNGNAKPFPTKGGTPLIV